MAEIVIPTYEGALRRLTTPAQDLWRLIKFKNEYGKTLFVVGKTYEEALQDAIKQVEEALVEAGLVLHCSVPEQMAFLQRRAKAALTAVIKPKFIGKSYIIEDTIQYQPRKDYTQEFFAYETIGIVPTNVATLHPVEYDGVTYYVSQDLYDKLEKEPDVDVRVMLLRDSLGTEAARNASPQGPSQPDQPAGGPTCKVCGFDTARD